MTAHHTLRIPTIPPGFVACPVCGEYNGSTEARYLNLMSVLPPNELVEVACRCSGTLCSRCGVNMVHRVGVNHYRPSDNSVWRWRGQSTARPCEGCLRLERGEREMDETVWLTTTDDMEMLRWLGERAGARKMRLFLCGCARRVYDRIPLERWRQAIPTAEAYADEECGDEQRTESSRRVEAIYDIPSGLRIVAEELARVGVESGPGMKAETVGVLHLCLVMLRANRSVIGVQQTAAWQLGREHLHGISVPVLRDIFGNPFRPVEFDPVWRTEHTVGIAAKMYDERDFAALPILADALQEAGCDDESVLTHCREPGEHVRGCWVVDLVLGKE